MIRTDTRRTIKKRLNQSENLEEIEKVRIETSERCRELDKGREARQGY
jgi:hypothetical protein